MKYSKAVIITLLSKGGVILLGILSSIVIAKSLGPSGRGVLSVLAGLVGGAVQFGGLGLNGAILYFASREKDRIPQIVWNVLVSATVMGAAVAVLYFIVGLAAPSVLIGDIDVMLFFITLLALPFAFFTQFYQSLLVATQQVLAYNVLDVLSRAIVLAGFTFILVALRLGTGAAVWSYTITTAVAGALYLVWGTRSTGISRPFDYDLSRRMIRYGIRAYIASLLLFFAVRINLFLVNSVLGENSAGLYAVALLFLDIISLLPLTLGMLLFPQVAGDQEDRGLLTAKVFRFSVLAIGGMCVILGGVGDFLITAMFGAEFQGSVVPLWCLIPGILSLSLWTILNNDLGARGMPSVVIKAPAVALVVNVLGNALTLDRWGIAGSAASASLASFVGLLIVFIYFVRRFQMPLREMILFTVSDFRTAAGRLRRTNPEGTS